MTKFWEELIPPGYYDSILNEGLKNKKGIQPNWHNITFLEIQKYLKNKSKHLDYACGPGTFISNYSNIESMGVDISEAQITFAKKKYGKEQEFLTVDEFKNKEMLYKDFDIITILGLFEFIEDEDVVEIINKMYDLLSQNGELIITTPNFQSNMKYLEKLLNLFGSVGYKNQHINKYSETKLIKTFKETKFKNFEVYSFLNIGIIFSIFSLDLGIKVNRILNKTILKNKGYLLLGKLSKN